MDDSRLDDVLVYNAWGRYSARSEVEPTLFHLSWLEPWHSTAAASDVVKDLRFEDKEKDKDLWSENKDF